MRRTESAAAAALIIGFIAAGATPAEANEIPSNYTFPDGSPGFMLQSFLPAVQAGNPLLSPEVLVGFNPQPDPPATPATVLSLDDPYNPSLTNTSSGTVYDVVFSFLGIGSPNLVSPGPCDVAVSPGPCRVDFSATVGDIPHTFELDFSFTGAGGVVDLVAFNPQPGPPGDSFGIEVTFTGDATMGFSLTEDGAPLGFNPVPEPSTLVLLGASLAGLALLRRRAN